MVGLVHLGSPGNVDKSSATADGLRPENKRQGYLEQLGIEKKKPVPDHGKKSETRSVTENGLKKKHRYKLENVQGGKKAGDQGNVYNAQAAKKRGGLAAKAVDASTGVLDNGLSGQKGATGGEKKKAT